VNNTVVEYDAGVGTPLKNFPDGIKGPLVWNDSKLWVCSLVVYEYDGVDWTALDGSPKCNALYLNATDASLWVQTPIFPGPIDYVGYSVYAGGVWNTLPDVLGGAFAVGGHEAWVLVDSNPPVAYRWSGASWKPYVTGADRLPGFVGIIPGGSVSLGGLRFDP
jgi:hypothetical protein